MKKMRNRLFAGGLSAFMLMNALPLQTAQTAFAAEIEAASRGDLNGDGKKDSADLDALKSLIGQRPDTILVDKDELLPYDITQDGFVDARDTYALSQYLSGAAKELPVKPGKKTDARIGMNLTGATCFPGDEVRLTLSFVEWTKDIAAYEITLGFDTGLKLKDVQFFSDDCQYVPAARTVKLTGLHKIDALHRGDFAVLTFTADKELDGRFPVAVEAANVFTSEYNIYQPVKPESAVTVYPLCEPVALEASGIGSKSVSLQWDMPFTEQPVTGYRVYRGDQMIKKTKETSFTDTGLTPDTDYTYSVSAVTASGAETAQSMPVQVHTTGPKILSADFPAETVSDANSDLTVRLEQPAPLKSLTLTGKGADGKTVTASANLKGADLSTVTYHWNVSELTAGTYTLNVTVTDTDGASDSAEISVKVENSPLKPVTLKGEAGGGTAVLTCKETDDWKTLKVKEEQATATRAELIVSAELPEEVLKASGVNILVTAADAAGNKAEREFAFQVDNSLAEIKDAAAKLEGNQVKISWTCPDTSGVSAFYVYRKTGTQGDESCVGRVSPQKGAADYACTDGNLYEGGDMIYRIEAEMASGNTVSVTLDPIKVAERPLAVLDYTPSQIVGLEYSYDATGSMNAADIVSLSIDYGDNERAEKTSVESAVFTHIYQQTGTYKVSLTVTNKSGVTDTDTVTVTVTEPSVAGKVQVIVSRMDGSPASNVMVYADLGTDQQSRYQTDAGGRVTIPCTAGTHEFGVFDKGYLPVRKYCAVTADTAKCVCNHDASHIITETVETTCTETELGTVYKADFADPHFVTQVLVLDNTAVTITVGDVNSDGTVDMLDAMLLTRYVNAWEGIVIDLNAADLDRNGTVDNLDAMILARYVAAWENYDKYIIQTET